METADRIREIIGRHPEIRGIDKSVLKDETNFRDHLGVGDLVLLDISYEIEEEFSIVFDENNFEFATIGQLIEAVEKKLQDKLPLAARRVA